MVSKSRKPLGIQKAELEALKYIDYARLKMYDIRQLLKYVFAPLTLYLTKEKLRKPEKHNLANVIAASLQALPLKYVPINDKKRNFAWFSGIWKEISHIQIKTFDALAVALLKTFS